MLPPRLPGSNSTYWLYSVLTSPGSRDRVLEQLAGAGVGARALWRPLHQQPPYAGARVVSADAQSTVGAELFARGISLPCASDLSVADQDRVIRALQSGT